MSWTIADIYLNTHGALVIMRYWMSKDVGERPSWPIEEYLVHCESYFACAFDELDTYCHSGSFTQSGVTFSYFSETLRELISFSEIVVELAAEDHELTVSASLLAAIDHAKAILAEDSFATDMAMKHLDESERKSAE